MGFLAGVNPAIGVMVLRVIMGIVLVVAGYMKWANGIGGFANAMAGWGFPIPEVLAPFVATMELVGGAAVFLGLFTRWLGLYFIPHYLVALVWVKWGRIGSWNAGQVDMMLVGGAVALALYGAGVCAVDRMMRRGA
ncbi:MAG: DoxX family protein [Chloroflexota bacterium]